MACRDRTIWFIRLTAASISRIFRSRRSYRIGRERSGVGGAPPRGAVTVVAEDCVGPNGVALSPNQQRLYVADSKRRLVQAYDVARGWGVTEFAAVCRMSRRRVEDGRSGQRLGRLGRRGACVRSGRERIGYDRDSGVAEQLMLGSRIPRHLRYRPHVGLFPAYPSQWNQDLLRLEFGTEPRP